MAILPSHDHRFGVGDEKEIQIPELWGSHYDVLRWGCHRDMPEEFRPQAGKLHWPIRHPKAPDFIILHKRWPQFCGGLEVKNGITGTPNFAVQQTCWDAYKAVFSGAPFFIDWPGDVATNLYWSQTDTANKHPRDPQYGHETPFYLIEKVDLQHVPRDWFLTDNQEDLKRLFSRDPLLRRVNDAAGPWR